MSETAPALDELRAEVDSALEEFLAQSRSRLPRAEVLLDEIAALVRAGGKRLRPAFCYWGYRAGGGGHGGEIIRVAAALELLHTFAIVHDDIMDASELRRGRKTVHARLGLGTALLVGDMALVLADDLLARSGASPDRLAAAFEFYSRMRQEVVAGQFAELDLMTRDDVDEADVRYVARLKSGRYSVKEPLLIGASLADALPEILGSLSRFGEALGEAFQLRDDLLGTFGDPGAVGKPVDSDIREGKRNVLFAKTLALLDARQRSFFQSRWGAGADLEDDDVDALRTLIRESGAAAATERLLEDLAGTAAAELGAAPIPELARAGLEDLLKTTTARTH